MYIILKLLPGYILELHQFERGLCDLPKHFLLAQDGVRQLLVYVETGTVGPISNSGEILEEDLGGGVRTRWNGNGS